jgi:hypothetical protein
MQLHRKKRIEIIAEAAIVPALVQALHEAGASGHTILPALSGGGHHGAWADSAMSAALQMQMILVIASPALADIITTRLQPLILQYKAVLALSDVEVIRGDHFA